MLHGRRARRPSRPLLGSRGERFRIRIPFPEAVRGGDRQDQRGGDEETDPENLLGPARPGDEQQNDDADRDEEEGRDRPKVPPLDAGPVRGVQLIVQLHARREGRVRQESTARAPSDLGRRYDPACERLSAPILLRGR